MSGVSKYGFKGIVEGIKLGMEKGHLAGDSWQQGGIVLLNSKPQILYRHAEEHPADWSDLKEVFSIIGINETNIDHQAAVTRWIEIRKKSKKDNTTVNKVKNTKQKAPSPPISESDSKFVESPVVVLKENNQQSSPDGGAAGQTMVPSPKKTKAPDPPAI